jgi:hypothetical protein
MDYGAHLADDISNGPAGSGIVQLQAVAI